VLPERLRGITAEIAKFGTIGVINLVINFAVSNLLLTTVMRGSEVKAKVVATVVAATCAYFMNRHWTYRNRPVTSLRREYTLFFVFNLVGMGIEAGAVAFSKYELHQGSLLAFNISTGVGICLGTVFRFWAYRTHVFKVETTPAKTSPVVPVTNPAAAATRRTTGSGAVRRGAVRSGAVRSGAVRSGAVRSGAVRSGAVRSGATGGAATRVSQARATMAASRARAARSLSIALADPTDLTAASEQIARAADAEVDVASGSTHRRNGRTDRPAAALGSGSPAEASAATEPRLIVTSGEAGAVIIKVVAPATA
jgi:putative flippase GtrA